MIVELRRIEESEDGTIGILLLNKKIQCFILENKNLANKPCVSCVPIGIYNCKRVQSPRFNETFEVTNVPNRTHILFHVGNTEKDTFGCLLPGDRVGYLKNKRAVLDSGKSFVNLMEELESINEFKLIITEVF